jgi:hypothetical protein
MLSIRTTVMVLASLLSSCGSDVGLHSRPVLTSIASDERRLDLGDISAGPSINTQSQSRSASQPSHSRSTRR